MSTATDPTPGADARRAGDGHGDRRDQDGRTADRSGSAWRLVASREIVTRLTDKGFLISTAITLLAIVAVLAGQFFLASRPQTSTVATTTPAAAQLVATAQDGARAAGKDKLTIEARPVAGDDAARAAVSAGDVDAWLHPGPSGGWVLTSRSDPDPTLRQFVGQAVQSQVLAQNAAKAGTSLPALTAGTQLGVDSLTTGQDDTAEGVAAVTAFVFAFLFYLSSLIVGMAIANSVVVEKQSRIVEILVSAIPVRQLLIGKIVGNTLLALGQMLLFVGVGLAGLAATPLRGFVSALLGPSAWFVVFFLVGFLALACVWAMCGALASRSEDLQATATPMTMLVMGAFFLGLWGKGTVQVVASYVPIASSISMPARLAAGTAAWWEPVVSILVSIAFGAVMVVIGERIYRRALLQTGGRLTLRKAWALEE